MAAAAAAAGGGAAAFIAAAIAGVMLDLEVIPERSLGNEQWQFILGMPFHQVSYAVIVGLCID